MAESWKKVIASGSYVHQGFETLHVGNIPPKVTPESLKIYFETFGPVVNVSIRQTGTQYSTYQYGYVTFEKESDTEKALSDPHHSVHFVGIKVNPANRWNHTKRDKIRRVMEGSETGNPPSDQISILYLNDDCLFEIALKLSLVDLLRLSQVCQRFEYIADFLFSKCNNLDMDASLFGECTSVEIREIMSRVGPYVQKVECFCTGAKNAWKHFEDYLPKYCSNIRILELGITGIHYEAYRNMFQSFKNLTILSLELCDITDEICEVISNFENIENLNLSHNKKITGKYLHKLIKLKILNLRSCTKLQSLHFNKLLANVKLEFLNVEHCDSLNSSSIAHLLRHQTELVTLSVTKKNDTPDLYPLAKLKSLKNLKVYVDDSDLILEELAVHNTGVEILKVTCLIHETQLKASQKEAISNLKNLKELCIEGIDDSFINQIASSTSLRYFCCLRCYNVSSIGILNLIRKSNTIEKIDISYQQFDDELIFKAIDILKEKQSVTRLMFVVCHTRISKNIQMHPKIVENSHLVDFKFESTHPHLDYDF